MRLRPIAQLSVLNIALAVVLALVHPHPSELGRLRSILHLNLLRDDSASFLSVACATAAAHQPLYRTLFFAQHFKFIYPPSSLFTCNVAQAVHLPLAALINLLALAAIPLTLVLDGELFLQLCPAAGARERWQVRGLIASLGLFFSPLLFAVYLGQMQALLDFLFTFAVYAFLRDRKVAAGLAVALVCCFKPPLAFFVLWAVLRREWRFLAAFAGAAALLQVAAVAVFGWQNELDYVQVLAYLSHHGEIIAGNQSVNGLLERWFHTAPAGDASWTPTSPYPPYNAAVYVGTVIVWAALLVFGLIWPLWRGRRTRLEPEQKGEARAADFLLFGLLATIASPIAWTHHFGLFYVGCIYVLALALRRNGRIPWPFVACFLVLANTWPMLDSLAGTRWNLLSSYDLYAGLGMLGTLFWLMGAVEGSARSILPHQHFDETALP